MSRKLGEIELKVGRYLVCMAISRILRGMFWLFIYLAADKFPFLLIADTIHTIILGEFVYIYMKHKSGDVILLK